MERYLQAWAAFWLSAGRMKDHGGSFVGFVSARPCADVLA